MKTTTLRALLQLSSGATFLWAGLCLPAAAQTTPTSGVRQQWVAQEFLANTNYELTALRVATDAAGNVYTLGQGRDTPSTVGIFLYKYSPTGVRLWQTQYTALSYTNSEAADLAVDAAGNVYVTGTSFLPTGVQLSTVKFAPTGQVLWAAQLPVGSDGAARALALDQAGNVYVTGRSNQHVLTASYSFTGQLRWTNTYDTGTSDPADLAVNASGSVVVVTGSASQATGTGTDFLTEALDATGHSSWVSRYDSGATDAAVAVGLDDAGNVVVGGTAATNFTTVQYGPDGQQRWVARFNGPGNGADYLHDLAVSAAGTVYVTGEVRNTTSTTYATLQYSATGQQQWVAYFKDDGNGANVANALVLDAAGNAYVTGQGIRGDGQSEVATVKYSTDGQPQWVTRYRPSDPFITGQTGGNDIALDAQGNVLVTGHVASVGSRNSIATLSNSQTPLTPPGSACSPLATEPSVGEVTLRTAVGQALSFSPSTVLTAGAAHDPLGRPLQIASFSKPSAGTLVLNPTGTYTYTPPAGYAGPVTLNYVVQEAGPVLASPQTRHYYEFVSAPGLCWAQAKAAAASRSYQGLPGYLATITYQGEQDFVSGRQSGQYWLGASDETSEGEWRWSTGPEAGTVIWRGMANGYGAAYTNWLPGQPDDYKNQYRPQGEDYALFYSQSGYWNDVDACATGTSVAGYLVEYGGLESCTPVLYTLGTLTIEVGNPSQAALARLATTGSAALATAAQPASLALEAMPNPSHGQFQVRLTATQAGPAQVELFDVQGRRVRALFSGNLVAGETRELAVDEASLATGLYQLRLHCAEGTRTLRVSIQP